MTLRAFRLGEPHPSPSPLTLPVACPRIPEASKSSWIPTKSPLTLAGHTDMPGQPTHHPRRGSWFWRAPFRARATVWPKRLDFDRRHTHLAMGMAGLVGKMDQTHSATHLVTWQRLAVQPGQRRHVRRASHPRPRSTSAPAKDRLPEHDRRHEAMRLLEPCNRLSKSSTRWTFGSWWVARPGCLWSSPSIAPAWAPRGFGSLRSPRGQLPNTPFLSECASTSGPVARARSLALPSLAPLQQPIGEPRSSSHDRAPRPGLPLAREPSSLSARGWAWYQVDRG
jgi:hypothetical protein